MFNMLLKHIVAMSGTKPHKFKLNMKICLIIPLILTLLISPAFTNAQSQDTCERVQYRIANYSGTLSNETFSNGTFSNEKIDGSAEIQFYNPNDRHAYQWFPTYEPLNLINAHGELISSGVIPYAYTNGGYIGHISSAWSFSPGISKISIPFEIVVIYGNHNYTRAPFLPDGNYTITHYYHEMYLFGYPLVLELKSKEITARISEPDWNYTKHGVVTKLRNAGSSNTEWGCDTIPTDSNIPSTGSNISSTNNSTNSPVFLTLFLTLPSLFLSLIGIIVFLRYRKRKQ